MEKEIFNSGLYGNWEKESLKIWAYLSKESSNIIDIGANTGIYSIIAIKNNKKAQVIAVEPIDINHSVLINNVKKNKVKIITEKIALSDKVGIAKMFMLKDKLNYMTSINDNRYDLHPEIKGKSEVVEVEVPIDTFENLFKRNNLNSIDLIKIDVEGHEIEVLLSMTAYIEKYKPNIIIEIIGNENAKIIQNIFDAFSYKYIAIDEENISKVVDGLWDNDHHNFLLCNEKTVEKLKIANLIL
ncbi:MAG: FkbM family methyltransferase [Flavobacteriia bacterium]|nr:FkbM family methyltransferase [Flavobacteriia bacterium]